MSEPPHSEPGGGEPPRPETGQRPSRSPRSRGFDPWAPDEPPPSPRFGIGCLIALIVSALGIAIAAVLVVKALAGVLSGVTL